MVSERDIDGRYSAEYLLHIRMERMLRRDTTDFAVELMPWRDIKPYYDTVCAWVMVVLMDGSALLIEDDPNLFPSDTLLGQLQLLITSEGNPTK